MSKTRILLGALMSLMLILFMTACGSKNEPAENPAPDTQAEDQAQTEDPAEDYDIASNLRATDAVEGQLGGNSDSEDIHYQTVETDYFTLTLPYGDSWNYEVDSRTSITFYNIAGREAGCGGRLFSLTAYDPEDREYETLPSYSVVGEKNGKVYVAEYPTDVQADVENEENMQLYMDTYEAVNKIREGGADSPLVLK